VSEFVDGAVEFVVNRDPSGCFGADVQALTGFDQDTVHTALAAAELYEQGSGVSIVSARNLSQAFADADLPISFQEVLPFFNGFEGDEIAIDDSTDAITGRLATLRAAVERDDNNGVLLAFACQRFPDQAPFLHFVAVAAAHETEQGFEFTVMDPSELVDEITGLPIGGVFQKSVADMRTMLTPDVERFIPVCAYSVHVR
jgi:hypothetical protein